MKGAGEHRDGSMEGRDLCRNPLPPEQDCTTLMELRARCAYAHVRPPSQVCQRCGCVWLFWAVGRARLACAFLEQNNMAGTDFEALLDAASFEAAVAFQGAVFW